MKILEIKKKDGSTHTVRMDDDMYDVLSCDRWMITAETCKDGPIYAVRYIPCTRTKPGRVNGEMWGWYRVSMHNEVMRLAGITVPTGSEVDHINGNGLDNRRQNLRVVSHAQNIHLQHRRVMCESGYPGIYPYRINGEVRRWQVSIMHPVSGERIWIGYSKTIEHGIRMQSCALSRLVLGLSAI